MREIKFRAFYGDKVWEVYVINWDTKMIYIYPQYVFG